MVTFIGLADNTKKAQKHVRPHPPSWEDPAKIKPILYYQTTNGYKVLSRIS